MAATSARALCRGQSWGRRGTASDSVQTVYRQPQTASGMQLGPTPANAPLTVWVVRLHPEPEGPGGPCPRGDVPGGGPVVALPPLSRASIDRYASIAGSHPPVAGTAEAASIAAATWMARFDRQAPGRGEAAIVTIARKGQGRPPIFMGVGLRMSHRQLSACGKNVRTHTGKGIGEAVHARRGSGEGCACVRTCVRVSRGGVTWGNRGSAITACLPDLSPSTNTHILTRSPRLCHPLPGDTRAPA